MLVYIFAERRGSKLYLQAQVRSEMEARLHFLRTTGLQAMLTGPSEKQIKQVFICFERRVGKFHLRS